MDNGLTVEEYQRKARTTAVYPDLGNNYIYPALGLAGEAGEVCEKIKKALRDDGGEITSERYLLLRKEVGDVLWYVANLCEELDMIMGDVAQENIDKLLSRKERDVLKGDGDER